MAHPTGEITAANLANLIPSVWGNRINDFFKEQLVMASFFTDRSSELSMGGDNLVTPNIAAMSANAKSAATAVTLNANTETAVVLTVDQWYEVSFAIDDQEAAQVKRSYVLQETYAKNAGFTIAQTLETAIAALFSGFSTTVGASSTNLVDSEIRAAIATLETAKVPGIYTGDVAFFLHPNTLTKASFTGDSEQKTNEIAGKPHVDNPQPSPYTNCVSYKMGRFNDYNIGISLEMKG